MGRLPLRRSLISSLWPPEPCGEREWPVLRDSEDPGIAKEGLWNIFFFIENVSSMDKEALREISAQLGCKPYKVQCSDAVPIGQDFVGPTKGSRTCEEWWL